jgi:acid phosphatase (class A)
LLSAFSGFYRSAADEIWSDPMRKFAFIAILLIADAAPARALSDAPYAPSGTIDAVSLLPPPPAPDSKAQQEDLADVLAAQNSRTPKLIERALGDVDIFGFATVLGPNFTAEKAPIATAFIRKVNRENAAFIEVVKQCWQRPRPFVVSKSVHPPGTQVQDLATKPTSKNLMDMMAAPASNTATPPGNALCKPAATADYSYSYPSGAASMGTGTAILLSAMVPEKRAALYTRATEYGENRVILGVHFPSDVEAGRVLATSVIAVMAQSEDFKKDFVAARDELRAVLGLEPAHKK